MNIKAQKNKFSIVAIRVGITALILTLAFSALGVTPAYAYINASSFSTRVDFGTGSYPNNTVIGDLDGDGKPDLALANYGNGTVSVLRNTSTSGMLSFASKVDFGSFGGPNDVAIGDLDGDGKPDLAVSDEYGVTVLRNTSTSGTISFSSPVYVGSIIYQGNVAIGDLDGDGKPDLAFASWGDNTVSVLRNTSTRGTISFASQVDFGTGSGPYVAIGDLDGDGKPDLATANLNDNTVSVLRNFSTSGMISFASKVDFGAGVNPYKLTIGDLNWDGRPDVVTVNGTDTVSVLRNTTMGGAISLATKVDFGTGGAPNNVAIGDLDGDGKPELATANWGGNTVSVLRNTSSIGTISFGTKVDFGTGGAPNDVAIGDVDGDGQPDLAVANTTSATISVLLNTTRTPTTTALASSANPSTLGASVTFTATVSPAPDGGTVAFKDGGTTLTGCGTQTLTGGQATCVTSALTLGSHTITAAYGGDTLFSTSTGTLSPNQQVNCPSAITVLNNSDSGTGSLRDAIANTCSGGTITFDSSLSSQTITLASTLPINKDLTIEGGTNHVTLSGGSSVQVMYINNYVHTVLNNFTIADGKTAAYGGGIENRGTLTISNVTFTDNSGGTGGAIANMENAVLNVMNSTFSENSSLGFGGGIYNESTANIGYSTFINNNSSAAGGAIANSTGTASITNSTFFENSAGGGGGIYNGDNFSGKTILHITNSTIYGNFGSGIETDLNISGSSLTLKNTILADNTDGDCLGSHTGLNVDSSDIESDWTCPHATHSTGAAIKLGTLGNYGGSTQTFPLLPGSVAIDAGDNTVCAAAVGSPTYGAGGYDQRGIARGTTCDIGAFESQGFTLTKTGGDNQSTSINSVFANPLALTVSSSYGEPVDNGVVTFTTPSTGASTNPAINTSTIASGTVSQSVTANSVIGGPYTVTASAAGAASVDFMLTNTCLANATVTNINDSGAGSLRQAITDVCSGGTITFDSSLSGQTITLVSTLTLSKNVTIDGSALASQVAVSGNGAVQIFVVNSGITASLKNLTITKGHGSSSSSSTTDIGGGIHSDGTLTVTNSTFSSNASFYGSGIFSNGTLMVTNSTFSSNSASEGAGIYSGGTLTVTNSTFSSNASSSSGGGIENFGTLSVANSTFSGNSSYHGGGIDNYYGTATVTSSTFSGNSSYHGGGIDNYYGTATLKNTIVANSISGGNCDGAIGGSNNLADDTSCGSNFTNSASILLSTLGSYGGSTQTIPLLPGSSAIDAGDNTVCAAAVGSPAYGAGGYDQRGIERGTTCDIGAFESQGFTLSKTNGDNQSATVSTAFTKPLALTVSSSYSEPVDGGVVTLTAPSSDASLAITTYILTIASGTVSQSVTANSTIGGPYTVTASAAGAAHVNFSLTNIQALTVNIPIITPEPSNEGSTATASATFTASSSAAPFTCTVNYGDGSGALTGTVNSLTCTGPSHTYNDNGSFIVTIAVTDLDGTQSNTTTHTVSNVAPTAAFNAPASAIPGANFNLSLSSPSDPSSADTTAGFTYAFDCGDGSGYGSFSAANSTTCTAGHNSSQSVKGKIQDKDSGFTEYTASVSMDVTAPTVTAFSAPSTSSTLTIPITTFTATDNVAVTGYMITTSSTAPLAGDAGWSASAPSTYTVASRGNYTLYPWARDAAGNVSALYPSPAKVNVGNLLLNGGFNTYVGPSLIPQYWNAQNFSLLDGKSTANVEEGSASIKIGSHKPLLLKTLSQQIMLTGTKNNQFTFSFWVKGLAIPTSASCSGMVQFYREPVPTGPGTPLILVGTKTIPCPTGTFAFQQKSLTFTAPGDFTKIMVTFTYAAPTGTVWFDNVSLTR